MKHKVLPDHAQLLVEEGSRNGRFVFKACRALLILGTASASSKAAAHSTPCLEWVLLSHKHLHALADLLTSTEVLKVDDMAGLDVQLKD